MANQVKFYQVTTLPSDAGAKPNALFFVTSTHQIYKGNVLYGSSAPNIIKPADGQTTIPAGTYYVGDIAVGFEGGAKVYDGTEWQELSPDSDAIKTIVRGQLEDEAGFTFQPIYETYTGDELTSLHYWDGIADTRPDNVPADATEAGYYDSEGNLVADEDGNKLDEDGELIPSGEYEATELEVPVVNTKVVNAETISAENIGTNGIGFAPAGQYTPTMGIMLDSTGSKLLYGNVNDTNDGLVDSTASALVTENDLEEKLSTLDNATHFRGVVSINDEGVEDSTDAAALASVTDPQPGDIALVKESGIEYIYIEVDGEGEQEGQKVGKWEKIGDQLGFDELRTDVDILKGDASTEGSVANTVNNAIAELDSTASGGEDGVAISISQTNGKLNDTATVTITKETLNETLGTTDVADKTVATTIGTTGVDTALPTEKAVRSAIENAMCWYNENDEPIED